MTSCSATGDHRAGLAFDSLAGTYDDIFTQSLIGRAQRGAVWNAARKTFKRGDHILELNCGTGEDALFLARGGLSVLACDASERMIAVASERRAVEAPQSLLQFEVLPTERIDQLRPRQFDGIFSNFSGLNCVADIGAVARQLSFLVKPAAPMLLCFSTRICLWETLWFLMRSQPRRAFRRWKGHTVATVGELTVALQYPTLRVLRKLFSPFFALRLCIGVGVVVPPSYLEHWAREHEGMLNRLRAADTVISCWPGLRTIGDHMLLSFERRQS
jgi:ubiquinone/menaquinone biosynthesis C-methylase UbiE